MMTCVRALAVSLLVGAAFLLTSCSSSDSPTEPDGGGGGGGGGDGAFDPTALALEIVDRPSGGTGYAVWAAASDRAFAGGDGWVFQYDGTRWVPAHRASDFYVLDVWGRSATEVYAIGLKVYHFDGTVWTELAGLPAGIQGIWGTSPTNLWGVTDQAIYHWDGSAWDSTILVGITLRAVWGTAADNVYAVGNGGAAYHYDGSAWSTVAMGSSANFLDIWGTAANDVWIAGPAGAMLHYDGSTWSSVTCTGNGWSISGAATDDVYALNTAQQLLHWDGATWSQVDDLAAEDIWDIDAGSGTLFGGGNQVGIRASGSWQPQLWTSDHQFQAVGGTASNNLVAVAYNRFWKNTGSGWTWETGFLPTTAHTAWTGAAGLDVASCFGWIEYRSGGGAFGAAHVTDESIYCDWGTAATGVYLGAAAGHIYHTDGASAPTRIDTPATRAWYGIWGFAADDIWAVGDAGQMAHFDGADWTPVASGTNEDLFAVWGLSGSDLWVAGDNGVCRHYDGTDWTAYTVGALDINVLRGWAADGVIACGDSGVFRFDGEHWSALEWTYYDTAFVDLEVTDDGVVLAVDDDGWVYRGATTE